ncbi:hypothetical protein KFK14_17560 [Sphingobium phenoxybenzoativorans]|uniref:Uncharacterized protein n=1 Tax=Sphingobium phenoxybenzoativorans TaxID=1592790 RepID=A0A975Q0K0_9SPHN|nr:hypothetical protein [Sphingobium phenoxybenzoativorans]QUT04824.1 hypothetical protein KFK14_17560 [Sphingobium phenoxybenzoativorans]
MKVEQITPFFPDDEQSRLYQAFLDANAAHTIACATPSNTREDRVRAAMLVSKTLADFMKASGCLHQGSPNSDERVKAAESERDKLLDAMSEAYALISAVMKGDMLSSVPPERSEARWHNIAWVLLTECERKLHAAVGHTF